MTCYRTIAVSDASSAMAGMTLLESTPYRPCTPATMTDAVALLMGFELHQHAPPFQTRLTLFAGQLKQWAEKEGKAAIQRALAVDVRADGRDSWSMLLGLSIRKLPCVRVPLWVTMAALMPYLKTDSQSVSGPKTPFYVSSDALLNPGKFLRNGVIQGVSDEQPFLASFAPLIGLMATLSSQPDGHALLQSALFEKNSEGKSVLDDLFMRPQKGCELLHAFYIMGLLFAFKLDVQRFNRDHSFSLSHCLIALVALHTDHHVDTNPENIADRAYHYQLLSELLIWAKPSYLSEATSNDLSNESAGALSAEQPADSSEEWWCLSLPGNQVNRIIEPRSWFLNFVNTTPYVSHPSTGEFIQWGGDDLYRLGILSWIDQKGFWLLESFDFDAASDRLAIRLFPQGYGDPAARLQAFRSELLAHQIDAGRYEFKPEQVWGQGVLRQLLFHPNARLVSWIEPGSHYRYRITKSTFSMVYPFEITVTDEAVTITMPGFTKVLNPPTPEVVMAFMIAPAPQRRLFPEQRVPCTAATMTRAMTQLLGIDETRLPLPPFKDRLVMFTNQLKKWSEWDGDGVIQLALITTPAPDELTPLSRLIDYSPAMLPCVKTPFWMVMDTLIPYLARDTDAVIKGASFLSTFSFPDQYLAKPGQSIRRLMVSYLSSDTQDFAKPMFQLVGLLATLSSQPNGHTAIQDALFEKNKEGKSALYYLFVGYKGGYEPSRALFLIGLLLAFKLDVKRFDRAHPYSFLHCLMVRMALSDSTLSRFARDSGAPPQAHMVALNTLCLHLRPSHFSLATQGDLSSPLAGVVSGASPSHTQEEWLCFSTSDDPNPIIEPRSWFQQKAKTDPFKHPITAQSIEWGGDDLFWLGIQSVIGQEGIQLVQFDEGAGQRPGFCDPRLARHESYRTLSKTLRDQIPPESLDQFNMSFPTHDQMLGWGVVYEKDVGGRFLLTQLGCGIQYEKINSDDQWVYRMDYPCKVRIGPDGGVLIKRTGSNDQHMPPDPARVFDNLFKWV